MWTAWAKNLGGGSNDVGKDITVDDAGNVYIIGDFAGTADFDPGSGTSNLTPNGAFDVFITKLDAAGNFVWAKSFGGTDLDKANAIILDRIGNVYITGEFRDTADFDPGKGTKNMTASGNFDIFISQLNASGNLLWAETYGSNIQDKGVALHLDKSGNLYTTGHFMVSVLFDLGTSNYTSTNGSMDAYVLKLSCTPTTSTHTVKACKSYEFNGVTYTASNTTATDTFVNSVGCDSIITLNLTINEIDVTTALIGDTITATANAPGASYQWINCKTNIAIIGATNANYVAMVDGDYAVAISIKKCSDTSACVSTGKTGINDLGFSKSHFQLYPNPTTSQVSISNFSTEINRVTISGINGKVLQSFAPKTAAIDLSKLQRGMYLVKIQQ